MGQLHIFKGENSVFSKNDYLWNFWNLYFLVSSLCRVIVKLCESRMRYENWYQLGSREFVWETASLGELRKDVSDMAASTEVAKMWIKR